MAERIQIGGHTAKWALVGRALMVLCTLASSALFFANFFAGIFVFLPLLGVTLWLEVWAALNRRKRAWIEVQDDGFLIVDRRGERRFRDAQVHSIAYSTKNLFSQGYPAGYFRISRLWIASEGEPIVMENTIPEGQADPLGGFLKRIIDLLREGFNVGIDQGLALEGDGWALTALELGYTLKGRREAVKIAEIHAVEDHDNRMCVWKRGEEFPIAKFPVNGRNVWLLRNVLTPRLKQDESVQPPAGSLGRVLFERKSGWVIPLIIYIAAAMFLLLPGVTFILTARILKDRNLGIIFLLIWAAIWFITFAVTRRVFRCHEWGVFNKNFFGKRQLLYNDVKAFTYRATRHYHNGSYVGTHLHFLFEPTSPEKGKAIKYGTSVNGGDAALDRLRDFIAQTLAGRMRRELAAGQRVQWTPNMAFLPKGIEYRSSGWFSRKEPEFMPYENYAGCTLNNGTFALFEREKNNAIMQEAASANNFFPGYLLLNSIYSKA